MLLLFATLVHMAGVFKKCRIEFTYVRYCNCYTAKRNEPIHVQSKKFARCSTKQKPINNVTVVIQVLSLFLIESY